MHNSHSKDFEGSQANSNQMSPPQRRESQADLSVNENLKQGSKCELKEEDAHKFKPLTLDDPAKPNSANTQASHPDHTQSRQKQGARGEEEMTQLLEEEMEQSIFVPQFDVSSYSRHLQERQPTAAPQQ